MSNEQDDAMEADQFSAMTPGPKRALVVDDDQSIARLISRVLSANGEFEVVVASEPGVALIKARKTPFDVIFSDLAMPGMDGLELIHGIRTFDLDVPIILLSGVPSLETAQKAVELGAYRYLTKPADPKEILDIAKQAAFAHRLANLKRQAYQLSGVEDHRPGDLAGLGEALKSAMNSLWIAYQPIVRARDGKLFGYEALLRSKENRLPYPGSILDAAEKLDRVHELGRRIREKAVEPMIDAPVETQLFLNLHPRDLLDSQLGAPGTTLTKMAGKVVLEITERESLDHIPQVLHKLDRLRELGFCIAVDDLGTGYAGLSSFAALQPGIVKIDMSLIFEIDVSPIKRRVVQSMVETCHELEILVVAEGVESQAELDACVEIGCDLLQGYHIAKPGPAFPEIDWQPRD